MPFALNLIHDQICTGGAAAQPLAAAHRLLYVRHGRAVINGKTMAADEAIYCDGPVTLQASADWSQVWRWELALPNAAPALLDGTNVFSSLRMSRVITHMPLLDGYARMLESVEAEIRSQPGSPSDLDDNEFHEFLCLRVGVLSLRAKVAACNEGIKLVQARLARRQKPKRTAND